MNNNLFGDVPERLIPLLQRFMQYIEGESSSSYFDMYELEELFRLFLEHNDYISMRSIIELAEKLHADDETLPNLKAHWYIANHKPQEALKEISKLTADGTEAFVRYIQMRAYGQLGELDKVQALADELIQKENLDKIDANEDAEQDTPSFEQNADDEEDEDEDEDNIISPQMILHDIAAIFFEQEDYERAKKYIELALKHAPNEIDNLMMLTDCLQELVCLEEALQYAERIVSVDPYHTEGWLSLSTILFGLERNDEALEALEYALAIEPASIKVILMKFRFLQMLQKYEDALNFIAQIEEDKLMPKAFTNQLRGDIYYMQDDLKTAHKYYKRGFDIEMFMTDVAYRYIDCEISLNKNKEAIALCNELLHILKNDTIILERMADAYYNLGDKYLAAQYITHCIKQKPESIYYRIRLGCIYLDNNDEKKAYTTFHKAYKMAPESADTNLMMAIMSYVRREDTKMMKHIKAAISVDEEILTQLEKMCHGAKQRYDELSKK